MAGSPNLYVLLPHKWMESLITLVNRLDNNAEFLKAGEQFADPAGRLRLK